MQRYAVYNYACMLIYVYQEIDERHPARRQNMPNMSFTKYSYSIYISCTLSANENGIIESLRRNRELLSHSVVLSLRPRKF